MATSAESDGRSADRQEPADELQVTWRNMADIWHDLRHIAPRGAGSALKESFEAWFSRVSGEIPEVPACVARDWLFLNWGGSPYEWLPLRKMQFRAARLRNGDVLRVGMGRGVSREAFLYWSSELGRDGSHHSSTPLGRYMREHRTWPVPILVLDNAAGLTSPGGESLARLHLIEGHMRLAFHHYLATSGMAREDHEVWLASIISSA